MKKIFLLIVIICSSKFLNSQVPRKVVVEHFTNTVCSVCASRNPGFFTNYNNQSGVIHLAVHPSSPYSSCILNKHNVSENDARTNYYGIYGSTPRLVIQGVVISSSSNYNSNALFAPYLGQTSPASIKITQTNYGVDSIQSRIVVKTESAHSLGSLKLFVALAEDTLFYSSPNGESKHFNVFRKSLTGPTGIAITLPSAIGDSVVLTLSSPANKAWNFSRIFTLAILQDANTKGVIQSESVSTKKTKNNTSEISALKEFESLIRVFASDNRLFINQAGNYENQNIQLYDLTGKLLFNQNVESNQESFVLSNISPGLYFYAIRTKELILKTGKVFIN